MTLISMIALIAEKGAQGAGNTTPSGFGMGNMIFLVVGFFAIVYFMSIRPQKRQQREHQDMISKLKSGDTIVTIGGICGEIFQVKDDSFIIKIDDKSKMEITKGGIRTVTSGQDNKDGGKADEKKQG
jgi:preprotein translocase subunit YajC